LVIVGLTLTGVYTLPRVFYFLLFVQFSAAFNYSFYSVWCRYWVVVRSHATSFWRKFMEFSDGTVFES